MADHSHEIALAARLDLQDREATLGIVEGDALDRTRECLHGPACILLGRSEHLVHGARREVSGPSEYEWQPWRVHPRRGVVQWAASVPILFWLL